MGCGCQAPSGQTDAADSSLLLARLPKVKDEKTHELKGHLQLSEMLLLIFQDDCAMH